jgi:hypothetical protein
VVAMPVLPRRRDEIREVGGGLGHVATVAGRADCAALAGKCHDESRAAVCADRAGESEAEEPALEIAAEFVLDISRHGPLGAVAIDVYEEEGVFLEDLSGQVLQDDELARLLTFPNVLVTAHQAFLTQETLSEIARVTVENLLRGGRVEPPLPGTVVEEPAAAR